jgi:hypothetical protein
MFAVNIAMGWRPGFDFQQGQEICLYSTASRLVLGPIQWVPPGREADYSPINFNDVMLN